MDIESEFKEVNYCSECGAVIPFEQEFCTNCTNLDLYGEIYG